MLESRLAASVGVCPPLSHNEERFSHGGAADGTLGEGSAAGDRAGMRKMCWTKPPPRAPDYGRLMALGRSAVCSIAGIRLADW